MKQYIQPIANGGAPLHNDRISSELQLDILDSIKAPLSIFNGDVEGVILSGCVVTANGGGFNMTAGVVYMDGQIRRVSAVTAQSFSKYIVSSYSTVNKTFADLVSRPLIEDYSTTLQGSMPGGGLQYIKITSLSDPDNRRFSNIFANKQALSVTFENDIVALGGLKTSASQPALGIKVVNIGDWNMDTTVSVNVAHGLSDYKKIRSISVVVRNDTDTTYNTMNYMAAAGTNPQLGVSGISTTDITLIRATGSDFDNAAYDSTSYNRGWVTVTYEF